MGTEPLVSVRVITYNSSKYVLDTLKSIKKQTYKNIELVISDDCSTDNTVEICKKWVEKNKERFVKCKIITVEHNTGVAANINRAIDNSDGEWQKGIAGDDLLLPNCIEDYVKYVSEHKEAKIVFAKCKKLIDKSKETITTEYDESTLAFYDLDAAGQFKILLYKCVPNAPTAFVSKEVFDQIRYNESYKYMEDIPMWVNLTKRNIKLYFLNKDTVVYRVHESVSNSNASLIGTKFTETCNLYSWCESLRYCREYDQPEAYNTIRQDIFLRDLAVALFKNKKNFITSRLYSIVIKIVRHFVRFEMN